MKARALRIRPWDVKAKNAEHMQVCSCRGCGNPRKHEKGEEAMTMQERRAFAAEAA